MSHFMLQAANSSGDPAVWFVCLLGVGVVFIGLVVLIAIVSLTNALLSKFDKKSADNNNQKTIPPVSIPTESQSNSSSVIENKQEILAAVCAAIAEENGTDISAIRVISFKKL